MTDLSIPIKYMLCDDCRGINGGCERIIRLERKINNLTFGDKFVGIWIFIMTVSVVWMGLVIFNKCSKLEKLVLNTDLGTVFNVQSSNNSTASEIGKARSGK